MRAATLISTLGLFACTGGSGGPTSEGMTSLSTSTATSTSTDTMSTPSTTPSETTPAARVELTPERVSLEVEDGCSAPFDAVLANGGNDVLEVTELLLSPTLERVEGPALPLWLDPGGGVALSFVFTPDDSGPSQGATVEVVGNDAASPTLEVSATVVGPEHIEHDVVVEAPMVDVMVLVDQSCSMESDNADDVSIGFPAFVEALDEGTDWQLGMITGVDGCLFGGVGSTATTNLATLLVRNAFNDGTMLDICNHLWGADFAPLSEVFQPFARAGC